MEQTQENVHQQFAHVMLLSFIAKDYMYTAGDGFVNPLGWSIAHIACKYGDVMVLELTHPGSAQ